MTVVITHDLGGVIGPYAELVLDDAVPVAEQVLGALAPFFPELRIPQVALLVLVLVVQGYQTGAIKGADADDPEMQDAAGSGNVSN